jgi:hypothetical protein
MEDIPQSQWLQLRGGEPVTLGAVMAVMVIALTAVIVYRLFMSSAGKASIPGGFQFEWK